MAEGRFNVHAWLQQYTKNSSSATSVSKPTLVTFWTKQSAETGGEYLYEDESGLATYAAPRLPADLNAGFPARYHRKDETVASPVDTIVTAALHKGHDFSQTDICTYRNNLNKILLTTIEPRKEWAVNFCYQGNSLFLDITKVGQASYANQDRFSYYGYHFESVCSGHVAGSEEVDPSSEFGIVVLYRLGAHTILMGAEVDGFDPQAPPDCGPTNGKPYVEMKTYRIPSHPRAEAVMYGEKHPRWWVQSFLAGVPLMVLGGRDDKGMLQKIHQVPVQKLPELSAAAGMPWDPQQLLSFGEAVLDWMLQLAAAEPGVQMCAHYNPNQGIIESRVVAVEDPGGDMAQRLEELLLTPGDEMDEDRAGEGDGERQD